MIKFSAVRLCLVAILPLAGCVSMAPEYVRPVAPVPDTFINAAQAEMSALPWRKFFTDPVLLQVLELGLEHNPDLHLALLRVDEASAAYGIQRSERMPQLGVSAQGGRARTPGDLNPSEQSMIASEYRAEAVASWELDLWGRVRSLEQSALQRWLATDAAAHAVQSTLISEIASLYLAVRELEQRLAVTRETVASREQSYAMFQRRYETGATARLEVTQVQTLLSQARVMQAQLEMQQQLQFNALRVLAGEAALGLLAEPAADKPVLAHIEAGLPSQLLVNRPDIVAAEHQLIAANANIGAARAAYFPRIALTGSLGSASAELDGLFASGSRAWTFMPSVSLPIFDAGRRRSGLELARVRNEMALGEYEKVIQNAFREVADALAATDGWQRQLEAQQQARDALSERVRLARLRYDNGSAAYLEVLDAERDLLNVRQQLIAAEYAVLSSQVSLYAALGGSFQAQDSE